MRKLFKTLFKVVGIIVGLYTTLTTLYWARVGCSRALREVRLHWDDVEDESLQEKVFRLNDNIYCEMIEEEEAYKRLVKGE